MVDSTEEKSGKFDVLVIGAGHYDLSFLHYMRRGKSRLIEKMMNDDQFNVTFITPDDVEHKRLPDAMWFDEMTDIPVALPMKCKPKPYWRQGERW